MRPSFILAADWWLCRGLCLRASTFLLCILSVSLFPTGAAHRQAFPATWIFEGMRAVLTSQPLHLKPLVFSFALNGIYLVAVIWCLTK